jgi:hypothetical protein
VDRAVTASLERTAPVVVGPLAGFAALALSPHHADDQFFSTSAQIVPVLLLGLILEARLFGSPRRAFDHPAAGKIERGRR